MPTTPHILLVEDDSQIGRAVSRLLREINGAVDWVQDGQAGLDRFFEKDYDLVVLDLLLPRLGGLDVCRRIRETDRQTPIVMLTAKAEMSDVVRGLELGADDYITKPFSTPELVARINAVFRRVTADREAVTGERSSHPLRRGALLVDPEKQRVTLQGYPVHLTAKEFELLLLFAQNPGRVFSRTELLDEIWGADFDGYDHTVNTHINRLRSKIEEEHGEPVYIKTVWGVGYRFADLDELEASEAGGNGGR
jgi:DNA-binding response OmpR family regulator